MKWYVTITAVTITTHQKIIPEYDFPSPNYIRCAKQTNRCISHWGFCNYLALARVNKQSRKGESIYLLFALYWYNCCITFTVPLHHINSRIYILYIYIYIIIWYIVFVRDTNLIRPMSQHVRLLGSQHVQCCLCSLRWSWKFKTFYLIV